MACYKPLKAFRRRGSDAAPVVVRQDAGVPGDVERLALPCGRCIGCRLERSRQWAIRCLHEAQMHEATCFLTLTYRPEDIPPYGSLQFSDFQKFMKRLRKRIAPARVRFFHCGEYGEELSRPHYHCLLFGYDYPDRTFYKEVNGVAYYTSPLCDLDWSHGYVVIGDVTFESAAYTARYCTKKITGAKADDHYLRADPETGEAVWLAPEYCTMSRRPGLGASWYSRYGADVFPDDFVISGGVRSASPRYYRDLLEVEDSVLALDLKEKRKLYAFKRFDDCSPSRLVSREVVKTAQAGFLKRSYENET